MYEGIFGGMCLKSSTWDSSRLEFATKMNCNLKYFIIVVMFYNNSILNAKNLFKKLEV